MLLVQLLRRCFQAVEQGFGQVDNHVVHLGVEGVRSEHKPVLFADFLDAFEGHSYIGQNARVHVRHQLWNQVLPLCLHVALAHECDAFKQLRLDLLLGATNG